MLLLDNSVLSAFTKLKLLELLQHLSQKIVTLKAVIEEYSEAWQKENIPTWLQIINKKKK